MLRAQQHKEKKIRLACVATSELQGIKADPITDQTARDQLKIYLLVQQVTITRIIKYRYRRTVTAVFKEHMNIQGQHVEKVFASMYERFASQCW